MGQGKEGGKGAWNYGKREKDETGFIGIMSHMNSQSWTHQRSSENQVLFLLCLHCSENSTAGVMQTQEN